MKFFVALLHKASLKPVKTHTQKNKLKKKNQSATEYMSRKNESVLEIFSEKHRKSQNFPVTAPQYFFVFLSKVKAVLPNNKMKMKDLSFGEKDAGNNNLTEMVFL